MCKHIVLENKKGGLESRKYDVLWSVAKAATFDADVGSYFASITGFFLC